VANWRIVGFFRLQLGRRVGHFLGVNFSLHNFEKHICLDTLDSLGHVNTAWPGDGVTIAMKGPLIYYKIFWETWIWPISWYGVIIAGSDICRRDIHFPRLNNSNTTSSLEQNFKLLYPPWEMVARLIQSMTRNKKTVLIHSSRMSLETVSFFKNPFALSTPPLNAP
jgi:hypothetical protein